MLHDDRLGEARRLISQGESLRAVSRRLGIPKTTLIRQLAKTQSKVNGKDDSFTVTVVTSNAIKTLEEAIAVAKVDTSKYYVERWSVSDWTTALKVRDGDQDKPLLVQQYRVSLDLRRVMPDAQYAAIERLYARLADKAKPFPPLPRKSLKTGGFLAVLGLFDVHFGKLAWGKETGENYDLTKAEALYAYAVEEMIARSKGQGIAKYVLPIGNDLFHIDNSHNTTHAGTPQDVDGRYAKIIETAEVAVIRAVERIAAIAPVDIVWVPGNHDLTTSYHLARTVAAWFRRCKQVAVNYLPTTRKYVRHGATLLGFTHGSEEKIASLPTIMATEQPAAWASSRCREWLLGHSHRSRQFCTQPVDTIDGVTIRVLRSLAATDAWHYRRGYISTTHAAEMYCYHPDCGYSHHYVIPATIPG